MKYYICELTSKEFNNLSKIVKLNFKFIKILSILHSRIKFFDILLILHFNNEIFQNFIILIVQITYKKMANKISIL